MLKVAKGYDCGIQIKGYNDIEERDVIDVSRSGN
jgi:translation initiation factor IF-2